MIKQVSLEKFRLHVKYFDSVLQEDDVINVESQATLQEIVIKKSGPGMNAVLTNYTNCTFTLTTGNLPKEN